MPINIIKKIHTSMAYAECNLGNKSKSPKAFYTICKVSWILYEIAFTIWKMESNFSSWSC